MRELVTDTTVLDDILEEWEDLEASDDRDTPSTFSDAVAQHYFTTKNLLADDETSAELKEMLASEVKIIEGWFEQFASIYRRATQTAKE